ncbi:hypothetical protein Vretifemale_3434 [Volvox reticuliferus]|nr:hypothetical protein Vretifemale_3434 [Volvox reticuliferus]
MDQALADSMREWQDAATAELQSWLSGMGTGTLFDASPEYLLVYLEEWWMLNHPSSRKQEVAGPQVMKGVLSPLEWVVFPQQQRPQEQVKNNTANGDTAGGSYDGGT